MRNPGTRLAAVALAVAASAPVPAVAVQPSQDPSPPSPTPTTATVVVSPSTVAFPSACVSGAEQSRQISVTNVGDKERAIQSITITGDDDFSLAGVPGLPSTLAPGASIQLKIVFVPRARGSLWANVSVKSDDPVAPESIVNATGSGVDRRLGISPGALSFDTRRVGTTSDPKSVTLKSAGADTVTISSVRSAGDNRGDFIVSGPDAKVLPAGRSTTVRVSFAPVALGSRRATLVVSSDACTGAAQSVALEGSSLSSRLVTQPESIDFHTVPLGTTTEKIPVIVSNQGNANLTVESVSVTGTDAADFALSDVPSLPRVVHAGESFTVSLAFTPSDTGPRNASLRIESDDASTPSAEVILKGLGKAIPTPTSSVTASPEPPRRASGGGTAGRGSITEYVTILTVVLLSGGALVGLGRLARLRREER